MTTDRNGTAVVTSRPLLLRGWESALTACSAFATDVDAAELARFATVVLDVNGLADVGHLLPCADATVVWVHGGIGPAEWKRARQQGVDVVVHRELGLAGVLDAVDGPPDAPRIRRLGAPSRRNGVSLTVDEVSVLRLLSRGATAAHVRRETGLSASQVERCRRSALAKLEVHTTGQALVRAAELGLITVVAPPST